MHLIGPFFPLPPTWTVSEYYTVWKKEIIRKKELFEMGTGRRNCRMCSGHRRNGYTITSNGTVHWRCRVFSRPTHTDAPHMHRLLVLYSSDELLLNCHAVAKSHAPQTRRKRDGTSVCAPMKTITVLLCSGDHRMFGLRQSERWSGAWTRQPTQHNNILNFKFRSICCRLRLTCIARQRSVLRWRRQQHRLRWVACGLCAVSMYWLACQRQWRL